MPKVLVIDDDEHFRCYLATLLQRAGYEGSILRHGSQAHALLVAEAIDAIVTDLYMPDMDGIEILAAVKRQAPGVPVIGISAGGITASDPCVDAMKKLGAATVLTKPFDAAALLGAVRDALSCRNTPRLSAN